MTICLSRAYPGRHRFSVSPPLFCVVPVYLRISPDKHQVYSLEGGRDGRPQSGPSIRPLVGTPVPAVTSTGPSPLTWLTEVPRIWRTASAMPFMPWM